MLFVLFAWNLQANDIGFSTAGFYELAGTGREVYNMNVGWRFCKGSCPEAYRKDFDDTLWEPVALPHGLELLPEEASGNINYQGEAWYRKHFSVPETMKGKKVFVHFEGIMGKSRVWLNGKLLKEQFSGYLPVILDVTDELDFGSDNILSVCTDNSDDPSFLPGKPQQALDFTYFGGIYRDCFLIVHEKVHITNANYEDEIAGGGVFIYYPKVSDKQAEVGVNVHLRNESKTPFKGHISMSLRTASGEEIAKEMKKISMRSGKAGYCEAKLSVDSPALWSPDSPVLHHLEITVVDDKGKIVDGMMHKVGIRKIEYRGKDGLYLNGKPYHDKLIGVNRHQDFAVIGNALPNSLHWRDAKKLRDAGIRIVRCIHYPHDPAFLDACDQFGILTILAVAGWQFWNDDRIFSERAYSDIRQLVRRDRNHASTFMWEPVLNETRFPEEYARNAKKIVDEEYKYEQALSACDPGSPGSEYFPVIFTHPVAVSGGKKSVYSAGALNEGIMYFTREFGDNVDDWNSHNSNSRVHRSWGESPMLQQAVHYASPSYNYTCLETLYAAEKSHIGGTLWHAFDHQRGYHPQPFYGGIMDAYRQPKTSYYMFMAQRPGVKLDELPAESGPMVYIANEMTPFSPEDVTVYSNCEEVRLTVFEGGRSYVYHRSSDNHKMPSPIVNFENAFHFMDVKSLARKGKHEDVYMLAEGLIGGKVVASYKRVPSWRPVSLRLRIDDDGMPLKADGSDIVTVIAEVIDKNGTVKRLNNTSVHFTVTGEATLLGDCSIGCNPVRANWGSAPALLRATTRPGTIKIRAEVLGEGVHAVAPCELVYQSVKPEDRFLYNPEEVFRKVDEKPSADTVIEEGKVQSLKEELMQLKKKLSEYELREVESQQESFGEKR